MKSSPQFEIWQRDRKRPRHGGVAIELALVLPVLMLLVFGAVDFGRVYAVSMTLANAARVGADQGATYRPTTLTRTAWENRIRTAVLEELQDTPQLDLSKFTLLINTTTDAAGQIQVQVTANYSFQSLVSWPGLPRTVPMQYRVTMEQYR